MANMVYEWPMPHLTNGCFSTGDAARRFGRLHDSEPVSRPWAECVIKKKATRTDPGRTPLRRAGFISMTAYRRINRELWQDLEKGLITPEALKVRRFELLFEAMGIARSPAEFSAVYLDCLAGCSELIDGAGEKKLWPTNYLRFPIPRTRSNRYIDAMTMEIHHDKHHNAYVTNLNKAIAGKPTWKSQTIEPKLISNLDAGPGRHPRPGAQQRRRPLPTIPSSGN
jgi:hypothetical protein